MSFNRPFIYFTLLLAISLAGCDFIYSLLQKKGAEEKELVGELVPSIPNSSVEETQKLLKLFGYTPGKIDGKMGPHTRQMLGKFQEDHGLEVTHFIDNATWARLNMFSDSQLVVNGEVNIVVVQTALKQAGFDPGKIDGKYGPKTQKKIRAFQKARRLKADGRIGFQTLSQLQKIIVDQKSSF